jgi:hypothetical protein
VHDVLDAYNDSFIKLSASTQAAVETITSQSQGLGVSATGGIAALVWYIIRKRRKAAHVSETPVATPGEPDNKAEKAAGGDYYAPEPTHELPGDDTWATTSDRTRNRLSELDSVRPASSLVRFDQHQSLI